MRVTKVGIRRLALGVYFLLIAVGVPYSFGGPKAVFVMWFTFACLAALSFFVVDPIRRWYRRLPPN